MSEITIARLRALRPGQRLVYYRGNFEQDIERNQSTPTYREILTRLRDTAAFLSRSGKVRLEKHSYGESQFHLYEYVAIGV